MPTHRERLSVRRDEDGRIARVCYVLPRHKAANWVGLERGRKSTRPGANGVVELSPVEFLDRVADLVPPPPENRHSKGGTQVFREPFLGRSRRQHVAHRPTISSAMLAEVPLAGLFVVPGGVWRRHPADCVHHRAGTYSETSDTSARAARGPIATALFA
jgi:hypothetical protein